MPAAAKYSAMLKLLHGRCEIADLVIARGRPKSFGKKRVKAPEETPG
jgi:hypothetical protein